MIHPGVGTEGNVATAHAGLERIRSDRCVVVPIKVFVERVCPAGGVAETGIVAKQRLRSGGGVVVARAISIQRLITGSGVAASAQEKVPRAPTRESISVN